MEIFVNEFNLVGVFVWEILILEQPVVVDTENIPNPLHVRPKINSIFPSFYSVENQDHQLLFVYKSGGQEEKSIENL